MATVDEKLATFTAVTGTDDGFANSFLEAHGWDVEAAVNSFIGGGGGRGAGGGSSSSDADKTPNPAPRRGKRPFETEASGNNKKLRVGDVCLGAVHGAGTTLVELLQPRPQHNAFNVLVPRAGHESRVFQQLVPVDALRPLPETAGQSVQLQTPTPVWLQRRGPSAYDTPVADVRATAVSYHGRQPTVTLNDFHDLEVSVPVKRVRLQFGDPSMGSVPPPTRSSSDGKSRVLSLVPRRPRLVAAVAVGTAAVVAGTALAGGLGFLWSWHAASTPVSASPALPHLPSLLGLMRCSSSCTSYQLGRARAAVGSLLGTLLSRFAQLLPSTYKCISDTHSLQDFHDAYKNYLSMHFTFTMFMGPLGAPFLTMYKMVVLMHGARASWDLRALAVLALIIANAAAYLPLLDKQRQNLASVALRADNFSPARVLSACFAHANEEHLFNNVRKPSRPPRVTCPASVHGEQPSTPALLVVAALRADLRRPVPDPCCLLLEHARARRLRSCRSRWLLRLRLLRPTLHIQRGRERRHLRSQDGRPCACWHGRRPPGVQPASPNSTHPSPAMH